MTAVNAKRNTQAPQMMTYQDMPRSARKDVESKRALSASNKKDFYKYQIKSLKKQVETESSKRYKLENEVKTISQDLISIKS